MPASSPRSRPLVVVQTILDDVRESATEPEQVLVHGARRRDPHHRPGAAGPGPGPRRRQRHQVRRHRRGHRRGARPRPAAVDLRGARPRRRLRRGRARHRVRDVHPLAGHDRDPRPRRRAARSPAPSWRCSTATSPSTTPTPAPVRSCASPCRARLEWCSRAIGIEGVPMREITRAELDQAAEGQTIISRFLDTVRAHPDQVGAAREAARRLLRRVDLRRVRRPRRRRGRLPPGARGGAGRPGRAR